MDLETLHVLELVDVNDYVFSINESHIVKNKYLLLHTSGVLELDLEKSSLLHIPLDSEPFTGQLIDDSKLLIGTIDSLLIYDAMSRVVTKLYDSKQLPIKDFNQGASIVVGNKVYMGGIGGVMGIEKNDVVDSMSPNAEPKIRISRLHSAVSNNLYSHADLGSRIELKHNDRIINLEYTTLNTPRIRNINVDYFLESNNQTLKSKVPTSTNNIVINLAEDETYKIWVTVSYDGGVTVKSNVIEIKIMPPLWRSDLAVLIYMLLAAALIALYLAKKQKQLKRLKELSYVDPITGLYNKNKLIENIVTIPYPFSIIVISINDFNKVVENYGYDVADGYLIKFSQVIPDSADGRNNIYRISLAKYALITKLVDTEDSKSQQDLSKNLLDKFSYPVDYLNHQIIFTVSMGVVSFPKDSADKTALLKMAELALHKQQTNGQANGITFYQPNMFNDYSERATIEVKLKQALQKAQLKSYVQPIYSKEKTVGFEVLMRWEDSSLNYTSPDIFIPVAEQSTLITELFYYQLNDVLACFNQDVLNNKYLSFNLSSKTLLTDNFANDLSHKVKTFSISPNNIMLEITGTAIIYNPEVAKEVISKLRQLGFKVALDDFGTGQSSLSHLQSFKIDKIKLDKSFIEQLLTDPLTRKIVANVINLSHDLQLKVIAEGVESQEEYQLLNKYGCDYYQGFYFSEPKSIKEFKLSI